MSQANRRRATLTILIVVLLYAFGLRIDHPNGGLSSALGPANFSVVIYKHGGIFKVGDKIVSRSEVKGGSPAVGIVMHVGKGYYDVQNGKVLEQVFNKDVRGRLLAVIPFVGMPLAPIGF